eukprot:gene19291-biopygen4003
MQGGNGRGRVPDAPARCHSKERAHAGRVLSRFSQTGVFGACWAAVWAHVLPNRGSTGVTGRVRFRRLAGETGLPVIPGAPPPTSSKGFWNFGAWAAQPGPSEFPGRRDPFPGNGEVARTTRATRNVRAVPVKLAWDSVRSHHPPGARRCPVGGDAGLCVGRRGAPPRTERACGPRSKPQQCAIPGARQPLLVSPPIAGALRPGRRPGGTGHWR